MRRGWSWACLLIIVRVTAFPDAARAQQALTLGADVLFYGDNTEFHNPFREGETIFGAATRLYGSFDLTDTVDLTIGAFGNQRFGSDDAFELVRPIVSLAVARGRSRFVFGTLPSPFMTSPRGVARVRMPEGPDLEGPHGLLPPMQRETLVFERPYEAGLQWTFLGRSIDHDAWLAWQRLNTPDHRERLDGGVRAEWRPARIVSVPLQFHVVHEGGQLYAAGPVRDSIALASGVAFSNRRTRDRSDRDSPPGRTAVSLELLGLWSAYTADRELPNPTRHGGAFFGRADARRSGWRAHLIMFRGDDYIKDEGDRNYLSIRRDGSRYRGVRDYAEAGLTRTFDLAPGASIQASFRFHRIERHYEYSFRVLGVAAVRGRIK